MSEIEPISASPSFKGRKSKNTPSQKSTHGQARSSFLDHTRFDRRELNEILNVYGRMVARGEWRDYAIDMLREKAVFSIFRKSSEFPLYRIVKNPKLARKQGIYSVITPTGLILKRGHELGRVLAVLDKRLDLVAS